MTREFELLVADLGKNIDVKNEEESLEDRKNALNFIYITPRQLIEKEGSEQKAVKVNLFMGLKFDLMGSKEDFRINSQYVGGSGKLGDDLTTDDREANMSMSACGDDSMDMGDFQDVSMRGEEMTPIEMACDLSVDNIADIGDVPGEAAPDDAIEN